MRLYRDVDYYLYFIDFPHMGIPGLITANTDGTVNIYINTLYAEEIQCRTVKHELRHFCLGHLTDDVLTITEKELAAEDIDDPAVQYADNFAYVEFEADVETLTPVYDPDMVDWLFHHPPGVIASFHSMDHLLHWAKGYARRRNQAQERTNP